MTGDVVDLFDRLADRYDTVLPFFETFGRLSVDRLPAGAAGRRLLDVGAGRGALALPARAKGYEVTAVDASPRMAALRVRRGSTRT